ncbi:MAG: hypothetical protein RL406_1250 [Pseudomonadota bacterium]|jgi:hypothetical protein
MFTSAEINCVKDFAYLATPAIALGTFWIKWYADLKIARYRETIAYIDKHEASLKDGWCTIQASSTNLQLVSDELSSFISRLELISHLINKKMFEEELVYTAYWNYFDDPLAIPQIRAWVKSKRDVDVSVLKDYIDICKKWDKRIAREQNRAVRNWNL